MSGYKLLPESLCVDPAAVFGVLKKQRLKAFSLISSVKPPRICV